MSGEKELFDVINYLQNDVKRKNFVGGSFWHNLSTIIESQKWYMLAVTYVDGKLAAYCAFVSGGHDRDDSDVWTIEIFETLPSFRRHGYGKRLVGFVESHMKERRYWHTIEIHPLPDSVKFWESCGYMRTSQSNRYDLKYTKYIEYQEDVRSPIEKVWVDGKVILKK